MKYIDDEPHYSTGEILALIYRVMPKLHADGLFNGIPTIDPNACFECGSLGEQHQHHVVPTSAQGTRTVPLCLACHGKVHNKDFTDHRFLIRRGQAEARRKGKRIGRPHQSGLSPEAFLQKHADVQKQLRAGQSIRHAAAITGKGASTVMRVARAMKAPATPSEFEV